MASNSYHAVQDAEAFSSPSLISSKNMRRAVVFLCSLAIVGAVVAVVTTQIPRGNNKSDSSNSAAASVKGASKFVFVPGSRNDAVRFEFYTSDNRQVLESRDVPAMGKNDLSKVFSQISATMQASLAKGRVTFSVLQDSFGFEIRDAAGQIVAFNSIRYTDMESLMADLMVLKSEALSAVVSTSELLNQQKSSLPAVSLEITLEDGFWGFVLSSNGEVIFRQGGLYPTKAECLAAIADYLAFSNHPGGNMEMVDMFAEPRLPVMSREHWDVPNTPTRFHLGGKVGFEYNYATIKAQNWNSGRANIMAWPETYWPTFGDGLSTRWQSRNGQSDSRCSSDLDCLSPLEKYDVAFNNWRPNAAYHKLKPYDPEQCGWNDAPVSKHWDASYYTQRGPAATANNGNDICHNGRDDSGNGMIDDCTKNGCEYYPAPYKQAKLARWFGLCHKWVPASLMEPEPQQSVTITTSDGLSVPFQVSDIKGLSLSMEYLSIFFGTRCNLNDEDIPRDQFGRIDNQVCRNTNAGAFHVVLTNMLGREGRPFAMDRTWDAPVWNQPVVGFQTTSETPFTTAADACQWLGGCTGSTYNWNPAAKSWVAVSVTVSWVAESYPSREPRLPLISYFLKTSDYRYLLELDAAGNIIGGEWKFGEPEHPDFLFLPYDLSPSIEDGFAHVEYQNVQHLIDQSMGNVHPARSVSGSAFAVSSTVATSTVSHTDRFAVFQASLELTLSGCPASMQLEVKLSHGLSAISNTVRVTNCQTVTLKSFAFANMLGAGTWDLDVRTVDGTSARVSSWKLNLTDKPLHA